MTRNNIKIAVTGGIGSGKSTVCKIIAESGYKVISCDKIYNELLNEKSFTDVILNEFDASDGEGKVDKNKLSEIAFNDDNNLKKLNELTHPHIINEALNRMSGNGICFCEVPLLFEGGYQRLFDGVIVVLRNIESRISSVIQRDGCNEEAVKKRIKSQIDYDISSFEKYYVIHNNLSLEALRLEVNRIIADIIKM